MQESKPKLDLNIDMEVTQRIRKSLPVLLERAISHLESDESEVSELNTRTFHLKYLRDSFTTKYVDENTDPAEVRRTRAIVKWLAVEQRNSKTNERLFTSDPHFVLHARSGARVYGHDVLARASKHVRNVLGKTPPVGLLSDGAFSGGATTSRKRGPETLVSKFVGRIDVTPDCLWHFVDAVKQFDAWTSYEPEVTNPRIVKGNVLFTVPKTAVIDRVACKEPDGNIWCQKAVGDFIRRRLKRRAGIDLNDQSINRSLALKGSIDGSLATIDLSSASDSLTDGLVNLLLPREWYELLSDLRSPKTFIDGKSHINEMFSSMGNGFTFELESLIFWALASAVSYHSRTSGTISVYGDDIIVPCRIAPTVIQVLSWCGFKTNVDKTFIEGPFRESCGGHYYRGLDVTPFYLRRPIRDVSDLILFLNQFRKWLIQTESDTIFTWTSRNDFVSLWYSLASRVPKPLWGGYDLASRTQLCSKGPQQCELQEVTRSSLRLERKYQIGMYLSRLCVYNKRELPLSTGEAAQFSGLPINSGKFVMRRCKVVPAVFGVVRPLFWIEQIA